jgi:hypothetical protein
MAKIVERLEVVRLRVYAGSGKNPSLELQQIHAKPNDEFRNRATYHFRKQAHHKALIVGLSSKLSDDIVYQRFLDEINDCYNTNMLLMICDHFKSQLCDQENRRYAEYLFAKLALWSTLEPRMCAYVAKLLGLRLPKKSDLSSPTVSSPTVSSPTLSSPTASKLSLSKALIEKQKQKATDAGQKVLIETLKKLEKETFFQQLDFEHQYGSKSDSSESIHFFSNFQTDANVKNFLTSIQRSSAREMIAQKNTPGSWISKQQPLITTSDDIQNAIQAIHMFRWDTMTREQKFVQKVIAALKQKGDKITLSAGVYHRQIFTFDRSQLLVLIRSNPSLCAEFKNALTSKPAFFRANTPQLVLGTDTDCYGLFFHDDSNFLMYARRLLSQNKWLLCDTPPAPLTSVATTPVASDSPDYEESVIDDVVSQTFNSPSNNASEIASPDLVHRLSAIPFSVTPIVEAVGHHPSQQAVFTNGLSDISNASPYSDVSGLGSGDILSAADLDDEDENSESVSQSDFDELDANVANLDDEDENSESASQVGFDELDANVVNLDDEDEGSESASQISSYDGLSERKADLDEETSSENSSLNGFNLSKLGMYGKPYQGSNPENCAEIIPKIII